MKAAVTTCQMRAVDLEEEGLEVRASSIYGKEMKKMAVENIYVFFFQRTFIIKHLEHLNVTMGLVQHGSTALFALPSLQTIYTSAQLHLLAFSSPFPLSWHGGTFTIHIRNTYVTPVSTTPHTTATTLPHLCCGLGPGPRKEDLEVLLSTVAV